MIETFIVKLTNGTQFEVEAVHHRDAYHKALRHCKSEEIQNIFVKRDHHGSTREREWLKQ